MGKWKIKERIGTLIRKAKNKLEGIRRLLKLPEIFWKPYVGGRNGKIY